MSLVHWIIVIGFVMLLFGAGRISNVMGEFAKGIKAFKSGMRDDDETTPPQSQPPLYHAPPPPPLNHGDEREMARQPNVGEKIG